MLKCGKKTLRNVWILPISIELLQIYFYYTIYHIQNETDFRITVRKSDPAKNSGVTYVLYQLIEEIRSTIQSDPDKLTATAGAFDGLKPIDGLLEPTRRLKSII